MILTKPVDTSKLLSEVKRYSHTVDSNIILEDKNNVLVDVLNLNPALVSVYDFNERLFFGNKNFLEEKSLTYNDFNVKDFTTLSDESSLSYSEIVNKLRIDDIYTYESLINKEWFRFQYFKSTDGYLICIQTDITKEKVKEKKLEESAIFFEHSSEGIIVTDKDNYIVSVNQAFCKITGYTKDEVIGKKPDIFKSGIHDKFFYDYMWKALNVRYSWQGEIWNKRKNGEVYPQWLSLSKVVSDSVGGEYYIAIFTDISSLKEADKRIYFYANHDPLTGLANRVSFERKLGDTIESAEENNEKFAIFFIDIDNFKYINDTYGHDVGDEIIKAVSERILEVIRKEDMLARIGGDEFTLIMEDVIDKTGIKTLAKKINKNVNKSIEIENKEFNITLSVGISIYPDDGISRKDLLKSADTAMYVVKDSGKNGFRIYEKSFSKNIERRFNIQNDLRDAIKNNEIDVYFQAVYDNKTNSIIGAEALARWKHKDKGFIPPQEFIEYAENSDLIGPLTEQILTKSCDAMVKIKKAIGNTNFTMAINISGKHFYDSSFENNLKSIVSDFSLKPEDFELELTETYLMRNMDLSVKIMNSLKKSGFKFALDDFGTGYSSLSYLKEFSINKLKIDKSFIDDCDSSENDIAIIKTIIQMGEIFNLTVQAEGVETKEQLDVLKELKCDFIQGYYYSKPVNLEKFMELI